MEGHLSTSLNAQRSKSGSSRELTVALVAANEVHEVAGTLNTCVLQLQLQTSAVSHMLVTTQHHPDESGTRECGGGDDVSLVSGFAALS